MLSGKIKYGDYLYTVQAIDTVDSFSMYIDSLNYESICFMCEDEKTMFSQSELHHLNPRRVDIKAAQIVVEYKKLKGEDGKKIDPLINSNLFCRIGALFRWCKNECRITNQVGYDGLSFASDDFDLSASREYNIKMPLDDTRTIANIILTYGAVTKMHIETDDFLLDLNTVELDDDEHPQFKKFPDKKTFGLAFNEAYLGFPLPMQEIVTVTHDDGMYHSIEEVIAAYPNKEFGWLKDMDYHVVTDADLDETIDYIYNHNGLVYYDTETSGLNINFLSRIGQADQCVGIILSVKYGESFYFPMQMKKIKNLCGGDHHYFMEHYVRKILEGKNIVAHNAPFDWKVSYIYDINANIVHDTQAMLELTLATEQEGYTTKLKDNAHIILNRDSLELSDLIVDNSWGENDIRFWDLPEELVKYYACADTDNTMGLHMWANQTGLLEKYGASKVYEIEVAFGLAVAYQEFYGHRLDINHMAEIRAQIGQELEDTMKEMVNILGHEFNPNSPKQLVQALYTELGIPEQISRKTGRVTTDKETLAKLAEITDEDDNVKYPFVLLLQKYRAAEGVRKIADKFPEHMTKDGYIFSSVYQYGTTTGRVSIHEPNYQSYNDPIKKNIVPRTGYYMFDTDYSSIEYRVLGNMVGNERIMKSFEDPDFDYHQYQAARMYGIPYANVTKKMRKSAKGINFGLPYGMGDASLGVRIFGEETEENTRKAAALRAAYFKGQEDIRDWFEQHRTKGVRLGYTETYFGRRRYYRKEKFTANAIRRQAGNQVIQGTAADLYKTAVGRVFKRICKEGWLGKVLLVGFIHDELLGEVSNDINPAQFLKVLREEFEVKVTNNDGSPWCPLYMGFGYGMSWYEAKSVELPIKYQWEIVEKYGDTGFPDWTGDGRAFCDTIPDKLKEFEVRDIRNQLYDAENQNKEIKPTLNTQVLDCIKDDAENYKKGIDEFFGDNPHNMNIEHDNLVKYLDEAYHIQSLYTDESGTYVDNFKPSKNTQEAIDQFCKLHDTDRSKINILDIAEITEANINMNIAVEVGEDAGDDMTDTATLRLEAQLQQWGSCLNYETKKFTLVFYGVNILKQLVSNGYFVDKNSNDRGLDLFIRDMYGLYPSQNGEPAVKNAEYPTNYKVPEDKVNLLRQFYMSNITTWQNQLKEAGIEV